MSLAGIRATRGSEVTVRRGTKTKKAQGDTAIAWSTVASKVQAKLQFSSAQQLQRQFGRETQADVMGFFDAALDLRPDDGLLVTGGEHNGMRFRVHGVRPYEQRQLQAALEKTAQTFA